jgi:hypothetical protein
VEEFERLGHVARMGGEKLHKIWLENLKEGHDSLDVFVDGRVMSQHYITQFKGEIQCVDVSRSHLAQNGVHIRVSA